MSFQDFKIELFAKLIQNSKSTIKLTYVFFWTFFCPIYPTVQIIHENAINFFFLFFLSKITFLFSQSHHLTKRN